MLNNIRIVLIETYYAGNIGASARAMKTMGLTHLYLVRPKSFPSKEATKLATSATDILKQTIVVDTLEAAVADCQCILGTSSRNRALKWPLIDARHGAIDAITQSQAGKKVAILFGNESMGLTNDELKLCHRHVTIPTIADYMALNVSQAVQVLSYECYMVWLTMKNK